MKKYYLHDGQLHTGPFSIEELKSKSIMKRVKLMLLSLTVLAVVGGALAFNVKGTTLWCTASPDAFGNCPATCINFNPKGLAFDANVARICTTTTSGVGTRPCKDANLADLPCTITTTSYKDDQ